MITYWAMFHLLWQVVGKDEHAAESNSILQTRGEMFAGGKRWWENILSGSPRGGRKSNWNYEVAFRVKEGNFARTYPNSFSEDRGPFPREEKRHRPTHAFFPGMEVLLGPFKNISSPPPFFFRRISRITICLETRKRSLSLYFGLRAKKYLSDIAYGKRGTFNVLSHVCCCYRGGGR